MAWGGPAVLSPSSLGASSSSCCSNGVPLTRSCLEQSPKVSFPPHTPGVGPNPPSPCPTPALLELTEALPVPPLLCDLCCLCCSP